MINFFNLTKLLELIVKNKIKYKKNIEKIIECNIKLIHGIELSELKNIEEIKSLYRTWIERIQIVSTFILSYGGEMNCNNTLII
jgi:hypothetical protein